MESRFCAKSESEWSSRVQKTERENRKRGERNVAIINNGSIKWTMTVGINRRLFEISTSDYLDFDVVCIWVSMLHVLAGDGTLLMICCYYRCCCIPVTIHLFNILFWLICHTQTRTHTQHTQTYVPCAHKLPNVRWLFDVRFFPRVYYIWWKCILFGL